MTADIEPRSRLRVIKTFQDDRLKELLLEQRLCLFCGKPSLVVECPECHDDYVQLKKDLLRSAPK